MSKKLTKEQIDALNLNCHIVLNANAGSGKTSVLVERYYKILEKGFYSEMDITPDNIVAITFTKKAAAEMLSRVINKFSEEFNLEKLRAEQKDTNLNLLEKLRTFRNKLTNAKISTIHSFCLEIISNYPIEAGIPVNFREISEAERLQLLEDSFNQTLMTWLENKEQYGKLQEILSIVKLDDLKAISYKAISNVDLWNNLKDIYSRDFQSHLNLLKEFIRKTYKNALHNFFSKLKNCFEDYQRLNFPEVVNKTIEEFQKLCDNIYSSDFDLLSFEHKFWEILNNFLKTIFTQKKTAQKRLFKSEPEIENLLNEIAKSFTRIWSLLEKVIDYTSLVEMIKKEFEGYDIEQKYFETSKTIFSFIHDVYNNFEKLKYESGFIEFSDMLIKTKDLFTNFPEIAKEQRQQIKYLLVDEFQDTDQVQFEIIQQLVPLPSRENDGNIPNLFIVGDEKQSIYSFRNADVRVFQKAKQYVAQLNSETNKENGLLKLTTTFRLKPEIASFVDLVMSNLMETSDAMPFTEFNIKYEPFVIPFEKLPLDETNSKTIAPITFLFETIGEDPLLLKSGIFYAGTTDDEILASTFYKQDETTLPYLIAHHIKYIVNNDNALIFDKETKSYRRINYSDIAIISRKTKDLAELATVLAKFGIPMLFFGSNNFFASKEIQDVVLFLKFLVDTKDDIALCGILRSIFFGFTDEILVNVAKTSSERNVSFWSKLKNFRDYLLKRENVTLDDEEYRVQLSRLEFAIKTIEKLLPLVSVLPINELIHRILLETEWHKKVKVFTNYEQMLANMDEFLDYAREYVSSGFKTIIDLLDEIDFIARHGLQDVDRFGFVSSNAVNLLTIHSAKGLEFPVVYVHKIDSQTRSPELIQISRELGLIFPIQITLGGEVLKISTMQNILSTEQLMLEQEAEEARILYVALTRASDYLVITGSLIEKNDENTGRKTYQPKNRLAQIFEIMNEQIVEPTSNYRKVKELKFYLTLTDKEVDFEVSKSIIEVPIDFIFDFFYKSLIVDHFIEHQLHEEKQPEKIYLLEKVQPSISNNILSSTKFYIYSQDPRNYLKSYFLGIHRSLIEVMKSNLDEDYEHKDNLILSSIVGNTIHYCLEKINHWYFNDGFYLDKLIGTIKDSLYEQRRNLGIEIQNHIVEQCLNVVQTKLFIENKEKILSAQKEFELLLPFNDNYLIAKIDLLFENDNGSFEIWDWKSNNVKSQDEMFLVAQYYKLQMQTYAFALSKLVPNQNEFCAKLLFTRLAQPNIDDLLWTYTFYWNKDQISNIENELYSYSYQLNNLVINRL